jgi:DNA-binding MarR family transcriptional regulator
VPTPRADDALDLPPGAGGLEDELGWSLHRVSSAFRQSATGAVADLPGGSRGYQVLVAVDAGPPSSQLALAQRLGVDRTAMTYLVDELEAAGLVTRQAHPGDRRVRHVVITPAGWTALTVVRRALRSVEKQLLSVLAPAENAQLRALLVRVARSTDQTETCVTTPGGTPTDAPTAHRPPAPAARRGKR